MNKAARIALVTIGLIVGGAVFGAMAGAIAVGIVTGSTSRGIYQVWAAMLGAPMGAVGLPVLAWLLLRRVALGWVILYSVAGTVLGGVLGWRLEIVDGNFIGIEGGLTGATVGLVLACVIASIGARYSVRNTHRPTA